MKEVVFIRHGATPGNLEKRYIGSTDEPLSPQGIEQMQELAALSLCPAHIYVSPMLRARQSAQILFPGRTYTVVEGLRETDFGRFEGKNAQELSADPSYRAWVDSLCLADIPGGDSVQDYKRRCCAAFAGIAKELSEGLNAIVAHGGTIMAMLEAFAMPQRDFYYYHIPNGGAIRCLWDKDVLHCTEELGS